MKTILVIFIGTLTMLNAFQLDVVNSRIGPDSNSTELIFPDYKAEVTAKSQSIDPEITLEFENYETLVEDALQSGEVYVAPDLISDLLVDSNPITDSDMMVQYSLSAGMEVEIRIYSHFGRLVRSVTFSADSPGGASGRNQQTITLIDESGTQLLNGLYIVAFVNSSNEILSHMKVVVAQ